MEGKVKSALTDLKMASTISPSLPSGSSPLARNEKFTSNFSTTSPYSVSPSTCSSSSPTTGNRHFSTDAFFAADDHRLYQACLILEIQELDDHYNLCLARLREVEKTIGFLRHENEDLRLGNSELIKLIEVLSQPAVPIASLPTARPSLFCKESVSDLVQLPIIPEQKLLPKSISVRSSGYLQMKHACSHNGDSTLSQLASQNVHGSRVYVPGKKAEEAAEFNVYNQGMLKTELCNKWQYTGVCPYGNNCQFAHSLSELRPVIRHPRYKTELCRMVVGGGACNYGHRCHFRHSLTEQERRMLAPR